MHVHILGICGTFMGGIAVIARQLGHRVTGSDAGVYPPMSTLLREQGIEITEGYGAEQLSPAPDLIIVGNAMKRGMPCVEYMLNEGLPFTSGPQWLETWVLGAKKVFGVAGTHGKTSTSSMLAWILERAGLNPGFLIGGVTGNFGISARVTSSPYFVIESDEYDCAFFDKRSKFVHYRPYVQILNNLEYDHADIFENIGAIKKQFHHLVRIIPGNGAVIAPYGDAAIADVLAMGCWSDLVYAGAPGGKITYRLLSADGSAFEMLSAAGETLGTVRWEAIGIHNVLNALMAAEAATRAGVSYADAAAALCSFKMPKRRMELRGSAGGVAVYDDFAHHPTAIRTTLDGLRKREGSRRIVAVFEPRSNTMKMGVNREQLAGAFAEADAVFVYAPGGLMWDPAELADGKKFTVLRDLDEIAAEAAAAARPDGAILVMSNGGFGGVQQKILDRLAAAPGA